MSKEKMKQAGLDGFACYVCCHLVVLFPICFTLKLSHFWIGSNTSCHWKSASCFLKCVNPICYALLVASWVAKSLHSKNQFSRKLLWYYSRRVASLADVGYFKIKANSALSWAWAWAELGNKWMNEYMNKWMNEWMKRMNEWMSK